MIGDQLRHDPVAAQRFRDWLFPQINRAPRLPQKIPGADEQVVAGRYARQRARMVVGEAHRPFGG